MGARDWGADMHSTVALLLVLALVAVSVTMHQAFKQSR